MRDKVKVESKATSSGVGFLGLLQLLFIALKLLGKISWKWMWVLMPTLAPIGLIAILGTFTLIVVLLCGDKK